MKQIITDRLCLGTAQLGLNYGIANRRGGIEKNEAFKILEYAHNVGLDFLDTAYAYGKSESIVGEFIDKHKFNFKIISKLPAIDEIKISSVEKVLLESISNLKQGSIYGYLIHSFEDFLKYDNLWRILENLKRKKLMKKIGFSFYRPQELDAVLERNINFDIAQIPYSIFDRRFEKYFKILKKKRIQIFARSIFLQGLVFLSPDLLPKELSKARKHIERLQNITLENNISIAVLCLNFALLNLSIDKIVIGIDNLRQLKENIDNTIFLRQVEQIYNRLEKLRIEDEDIILPNKWDIK